MKTDPHRLVRAHYATYVDARDGRRRWQDHVLFAGLPLLVLGAAVWRDLHLTAAASAALLTVSGLLSAFLFGVMLQISQRAMEWADTKPEPGEATSEQADFLREIAANAGYAALVAISAAALFVVATMTKGSLDVVASALALSLGVHLILVLLMVVVRIFDLTDSWLRRAQTGATVHRLPTRKVG